MSATKIVVIYSLDQSRVRRFIIPDSDDQISRHANPGKGEGVLLMDYYGFTPPIELINQYIATTTGKPVKDDRYVIVDDKGKAKLTVLMDPLTDDGDRLVVDIGDQVVSAPEAAALEEAKKP